MRLPLHGIRVIDLSHSWAAPHCTRLLADYGAEVIKVEYVRRLCILRGAARGDAAYERQPGWLQVNRGKLSITLDLDIARDRDVLRDLVRVSGVLVENSRTGVLERLGLGYAALAAIRPDLVMLSMSAFGNTGRWATRAGYGAVFEALSGVMSLTAHDREAKPARIKELDTMNGVVGACAVMTALFHRARTGQGQHIDLSQLEATTHATAGEHLLEASANGRQTLPLGNRHPRYAPQGCYRCAGVDRWLAITVRSDDEWRRFCAAVDHAEWAADPRFATAASRRRHHDDLDRSIASWTAARDHLDAMHALQGVGIAAAAVLDPREVCADPHLRARRTFVVPEHGSDMPYLRPPIRLSAADAAIRRPGPRLGEHDTSVRREILGYPNPEVATIEPENVGLAYDPE